MVGLLGPGRPDGALRLSRGLRLGGRGEGGGERPGGDGSVALFEGAEVRAEGGGERPGGDKGVVLLFEGAAMGRGGGDCPGGDMPVVLSDDVVVGREGERAGVSRPVVPSELRSPAAPPSPTMLKSKYGSS